MRRKLPPLNAVRAFEAVVRLGSFTRAAAEFNVTTGAISRQIKSLERFLGVKVHSVSGRGFEPTPAARKFAAEVRLALDQIADSAERLIEPSSASVIHLDSSPAFALQWLIPRLRRFERSHVGTQVHLTTSGKSSEDLGRRFDVIIRRFPLELPGYRCERLVLDFGIPVGTPGLFRSQPLGRPSDLRNHTLLSCDGHDGVWERWMAAAGIRHDLKPGRYDQFFTLMQALLQGFGVALGPVTLVAESIQAGQLVTPLIEPRATFPPYYVLSREDCAAPSRVHELVTWLLSEARIFENGISDILEASARARPRLEVLQRG